MWQCKKCNFKNSNSSEKCHGKQCMELRSNSGKHIEETIIKQKINKVRIDFCPICDTNRTFTQRTLGWKCGGCGKYFRIKKEKNAPKKQLTVPEDTWDGQ